RIACVAFQRLPEIVEGLRMVRAGLGGAQVIEYFIQRNHARHQLKGSLRTGEVACIVAAESEKKTCLVVMHVHRSQLLEPVGGGLVFLPGPKQTAEFKTRLRIVRIEPGGLGEETMLLVGAGGEQAANVVFDGVHADAGVTVAELGFRRRSLELYQLQYLPGK